MSSYHPTKAQMEALDELKAALAKCSRAKVYLWDDYGTISAVNGRVVKAVTSDDQHHDAKLDGSQVVRLGKPGCWHSSNSDDQLYIELN